MAATEREFPIEAIHRRWTRCIAEGEFAAITGAFAADAQLLLPNRAPISGRAAIAQAWAGIFCDPGTVLVFRQGRVQTAPGSDVAYCVGAYLREFDGPRGRAFDEGKYLSIWRRRQEQWGITFLKAEHRSSGVVYQGQALSPQPHRRPPSRVGLAEN